MRKTTLIILTVLFCSALYAQTDTTAPPKPWRWSGLYSAALTQTSLTNWAAGGNNNVNVSGLVKQLGVMSKNKWQWNNLLELNFGYNFQPGLNNKTDDRLEFTTRLDRNVAKDLDVSLFVNFRTQMADGFTNPGDPDSLRISTFMAPAYLTYGLGLTYKGVPGLSVYVSPVTVKQTFVLDSILAVNDVFFDNESPNVRVVSDGVYRSEFGAYIDIIYAKAFSESFFEVSRFSSLGLFLRSHQMMNSASTIKSLNRNKFF